MRVVAIFHVHPKRAGQMVDLALGLGAQIAFEAEPEIEVIPDEIIEPAASAVVDEGCGTEGTESAVVPASNTEDAGDVAASDAVTSSASPASDGGDDTGSEGADTTSPAPATVNAETEDVPAVTDVPAAIVPLTPMADVATADVPIEAAPEAATESEVIHEQLQRSEESDKRPGGEGKQDGGIASVEAEHEPVNADADSKLAGIAGEKPAE